MLRKLNITLGILCVIGALFISGIALYDHMTDPTTSKVIEQLREDM